MTKISDKSADNQSEARISVAYNKNCHSSLMTSFVKHPQVSLDTSMTLRLSPNPLVCQGCESSLDDPIVPLRVLSAQVSLPAGSTAECPNTPSEARCFSSLM